MYFCNVWPVIWAIPHPLFFLFLFVPVVVFSSTCVAPWVPNMNHWGIQHIRNVFTTIINNQKMAWQVKMKSKDLTCRDSRKMRLGRSPVWSSLPSAPCWVHQHSWWWWGRRDQDNSSRGDACTCTNMFPFITLHHLTHYMITSHFTHCLITLQLSGYTLHFPGCNVSWMHYFCINLAYTRLHNTWHIAWYITPSTRSTAWLF